jgi:hypothetical protein
MADIKFDIDPEDLPEDRINKHKDFKKLMYNYQLATKPLHKTPLSKFKYRRVFVIILLILLIMFLIIEVSEKGENQPESPAIEELPQQLSNVN